MLLSKAEEILKLLGFEERFMPDLQRSLAQTETSNFGKRSYSLGSVHEFFKMVELSMDEMGFTALGKQRIEVIVWTTSIPIFSDPEIAGADATVYALDFEVALVEHTENCRFTLFKKFLMLDSLATVEGALVGNLKTICQKSTMNILEVVAGKLVELSMFD